MKPPLPINEHERLSVLDRCNILDTPKTAEFERLTALAAQLFAVPIAAVSLVDRDRQFFKSCFGLDVRETPREYSFCAHAIVRPEELLVVEDAFDDPRFCDNPLVTGFPHIRFYAGMPIMDTGSSAIGALCIIDTKPRILSEDEQRVLRLLAAIAEDEVHLHERRLAVVESEQNYKQLYEVGQEAINNLKSRLSRLLSHELRTPLNGILGNVELLRDEWSDDEREDIMNDLQSSGRRMERTVENLCLIAELELNAGGPSLPELSKPDFREIHLLVPSVATRVAEEYDRLEGLQLNVQTCVLRIESFYFSKLMFELIDNAFKFSAPDHPVKIIGRFRGDVYRLTVENENADFESHEIEAMGTFVQFNREAREQQGLGLGFSVTKKLAEVCGLTLLLERSGPSSVRATVDLPLDAG